MLIWNASRQRAEIAARCDLIETGSATLEVMLRNLREIPQDAGLVGDAHLRRGGLDADGAPRSDSR